MPRVDLLRVSRLKARRTGAFVARARHLAPWPLAGAILAFLFSQFFSILAFFLPLKAILLLASEGVPWYLAGVATAETKDTLVFVIAITAVVSYGLHLVSDKLHARAVKAGSEHVVGRAGKLRLFKNQSHLARDGFRHLSEIVGSIVILVLATALGLYINMPLFSIFLLLLVSEYGVLYWLLKSDSELGRSVRSAFERSLARTAGLIGTWNFLIGFVILFIEFLAMEQRNIVVAILSIILIRQLTQQIKKCVTSVVFVSRNHQQLNALFYAAVPYTPVKEPFSFLRTLSGPSRTWVLESALEDVIGESVDVVGSTWVDSDIPGGAYFEVAGRGQESDELEVAGHGAGGKYLVKCYDKKRSVGAEHEVHLFESMEDNALDAPKFIGDTYVDDIRVLVFEGLPEERVSRAEWKEAGFITLFRLWAVEPDEDLLRAYLRTHPTIAMRLGPELFSQMRIAVDGRQDREILRRLKESWGDIKSEVERVPLVIDNPGMKDSFCRRDSDGNIWCFSWNRWRIEPVGCNSRMAKLDQEEIQELCEKAAEHDVPVPASPAQVLLVSRLFELENALLGSRFRSALDTAGAVLEIMEASTTMDQPELIGDTGT